MRFAYIYVIFLITRACDVINIIYVYLLEYYIYVQPRALSLINFHRATRIMLRIIIPTRLSVLFPIMICKIDRFNFM